MHNCKLTRRSLIELAMNELPPSRATQLLTELKDCAGCQDEYFSIRSVLRTSGQALQSTLPAESFWAGYHARLSTRLENYSSFHQPVQSPPALRFWTRLRQIVTASVRIPVPAAAALMLLIGVFGFFAVRSRGQVAVVTPTPASLAPLTVIKTIEVPVEKTVTRVVYVEKPRRRSPGNDRPLDRSESPNVANRVANSRANTEGITAMSLIGFKPTEQVKLKVVKGSYRDEK